jgi:dCTP deaminase
LEELSEYEQKLSIHHINKNKFDCSENNLISLCIRCHSKINSTPRYFEYVLKFQTGINNMCILSNEDIKECIDLRVLNIYGMNEKTIRENGLDLTLSGTYAIESETYNEKVVDLHNQDVNRFSVVKSDGKFILHPNQFMLLSTKEIISVPNNIMGFCAIRSTIARSGILCPQTVLDCGFSGALTIEVFNSTKKPIILTEGDRFLHVVLSFTKTPSSVPYCGMYQGQNIVTPPKNSIL